MTKNKFNFSNSVFPHVFPQKNKGIFILKTLLIFFSFFNPSFAHEGCRNTFIFPNSSKKGSKKVQLQGNNSKLESNLKEQIEQIEQTKLLNTKEKQSLLTELDKTIHFIRNQNSTPRNEIRKRTRLQGLELLLLKALEETPKILNFLENTPSPYLNKKQSVQIILTSLTKFVRVHLNHPDEESLIDFSLYKKILTSIGAFDNNLFSIYQITRAVREKHSIYEYLNCN